MITYVQIGERTYETEITEHHGELRVTLDGEPCEVSYDEVDTYGQIVLIHGGKSYAMSIEGSTHEVAVTIAGHRYDLSLEDERERADRATCAVCFASPKSVAFLPCGHVACCESCAARPELKTCPLCKERVEQRSRIFLP